MAIYVTSPALPPLEEYIDEIRSIWDTGILTHQGPKHNLLQKNLEEYLDIDHVCLFANGHLALELAIKAMGLTGEIITTPFTFGSTTQAILRNGIKPVFCDIREDNYTMDADKIEELITDKTTAIIPVHVYGNVCDAEKIDNIAKKHHLKVIYDAAHAFGEEWNGINVAKLGDVSMFSFHATKVFNTVEGGCLTYKDGNLTQILEGLRQFGQIVQTDEVPYVGTNAKMTEIHAAMGLCNLRHLDEYIEKRKKVVETYRELLSGKAGIQMSPLQKNVKNNYSYFPVVFDEREFGKTRDEVALLLAKENIFARKYFYPLTSDFSCCKERGIVADVPISRRIADRVLTLPCYPELKISEVHRICDIILS